MISSTINSSYAQRFVSKTSKENRGAGTSIICTPSTRRCRLTTRMLAQACRPSRQSGKTCCGTYRNVDSQGARREHFVKKLCEDHLQSSPLCCESSGSAGATYSATDACVTFLDQWSWCRDNNRCWCREICHRSRRHVLDRWALAQRHQRVLKPRAPSQQLSRSRPRKLVPRISITGAAAVRTEGVGVAHSSAKGGTYSNWSWRACQTAGAEAKFSVTRAVVVWRHVLSNT